jgi:hypothetical protein
MIMRVTNIWFVLLLFLGSMRVYAEVKVKNAPVSLHKAYNAIPGADAGSPAAFLPLYQQGYAGYSSSNSSGSARGIAVQAPYFRFISAENTNLGAFDEAMVQDVFGLNSSNSYSVDVRELELATGIRLQDWVSLKKFDVSLGVEYSYQWGRLKFNDLFIASATKESHTIKPSLAVSMGEKSIALRFSPDELSWQFGYYVHNTEPASEGVFGMIREHLQPSTADFKYVAPLSWGVFAFRDEKKVWGGGVGLQYWFFELFPVRLHTVLGWNTDGRVSQQQVSMGSSLVLRRKQNSDSHSLARALELMEKAPWLIGTELGFDVFQDVKFGNSVFAIKLGRYF